MALRFACFISSCREGRMADRMVKLIQAQFNQTMQPKGHQLELIDPVKYDLPLLKKPLHFYKDRSEAPEILQTLNEKVEQSDCFLILTAEYNMNLPPALTNLMSQLPPPSFEYKPSGLISYTLGTRGGLAACVAARPYLAELGCLPVKHMTTVSSVHQEVNEDGSTENHFITESLDDLFQQVAWWGEATKLKRHTDGVPAKKGYF
ncbi:uncharacterized protein [Clytia hemisphaerica]|uniref:NADPH-dependent FMN reductase-like domain-containing protein n=1 Tax=Clytia hemisphaerica TaxID=252671 RepID=A0A7M5X7R0_9CNID|eukprot:TCONS_00018379-protein